ncbi:unnamed protein product [Phyllotreta striolata]|uniref:CRAL-TRIO domain-containing protein n=1 Tax=Phyllotreta striolata TaxID=444603 RepID=A0A9N9XQ78_PHYSR|nr:unnamed protein product [Phyllotreta striolata]
MKNLFKNVRVSLGENIREKPVFAMISHEYFAPTTEDIEIEVWKGFDKTKDAISKDIESIKTWLKSQPHLPHTLSDKQIRSFLLLGKGSAEKIKPKIDMYYTMRSLYPDIFDRSHPFDQRMLEAKKYMYIIPLPKRTSDHSRILVLKLKDEPDSSGMDPSAIFARLLNTTEVRLQEDFCSGHTVLFDMEHCKLQHVAKVTPTFIRSSYNIGEKALTTRVQGIHVINAPAFTERLLVLVKSIVKPKMANRIFLHRDMESIINSIDKNILPKDYGGNEKSLDELEAEFDKKFEEYRSFFDRRVNERVNEQLRPAGMVNDDFLGYHGSFKKLAVD